jgi:metal-dependent amidase/aminoacylase/carboxypeptidase family protein
MVLNQLRERGLAAASGGSDDVGYFEWSAPTDEISLENAAFANPGLNITIHPDNIRAVFNDPPDVVMTEVLNQMGADNLKRCRCQRVARVWR